MKKLPILLAMLLAGCASTREPEYGNCGEMAYRTAGMVSNVQCTQITFGPTPREIAKFDKKMAAGL